MERVVSEEVRKLSGQDEHIMIRHFEPVRYAFADSPLSDEGIRTCRQIAGSFFGEFKANDRSHVIRIFASGRPRTLESARILYDEFNILTSKYDGRIKILYPQSCSSLEPNFLDPLEDYVDNPDNLFNFWRYADSDFLRRIGSKDSSQLLEEFQGFLVRLDRKNIAAQLRRATEVITKNFYLTHEPHLEAIVKNGIGLENVQYVYGEQLRLRYTSNGQVALTFRNQEFERSLVSKQK